MKKRIFQKEKIEREIKEQMPKRLAKKQSEFWDIFTRKQNETRKKMEESKRTNQSENGNCTQPKNSIIPGFGFCRTKRKEEEYNKGEARKKEKKHGNSAKENKRAKQREDEAETNLWNGNYIQRVWAWRLVRKMVFVSCEH